MNWLKQHHRALWRFYREALGESLLITAAAFVIICLLAFGAGLLNKSIPAMAMDYIQRIMDIKDIVTDEGGIDLAALFGNNVRAAAVSVLYGFIPFLYLTALALGMNAIILGIFAAYFVNTGTSLLVYFAGILPHGVFELPALVLFCAAGLYLCSRVTARVRGDKEVRILRTLSEVSTLFLYVILPLLAAAALMETYVTPRLLAMVL